MAERDRIGLPPRIFLYTIDQVAQLLSLTQPYVKNTLLFYDRREPGLTPKTRLRAINIAPEGETPEWRVAERELIRYLRSRGVKFYETGYGM